MEFGERDFRDPVAASHHQGHIGLVLTEPRTGGYFPSTGITEHLRTTGTADWRTSSEGLLPGDGNAGQVYRLRDVTGNSPLHLAQYDRFLDQHQVELAGQGGCVLASRLAIWLLPRAHLRVYLAASPEARAWRIAQREGGDWQRSLQELAWRDARDRERSLTLYGIDVDRYPFADLVVDTERGGPEYVVREILTALDDRGGKPPSAAPWPGGESRDSGGGPAGGASPHGSPPA